MPEWLARSMDRKECLAIVRVSPAQKLDSYVRSAISSPSSSIVLSNQVSPLYAFCLASFSSFRYRGLSEEGKKMQSFRFGFLAFVIPFCAGCGTFHNLKSQPDGQSYMGFGECRPFNGVIQSTVAACILPPAGLSKVIEGDKAVFKGDFDKGFDKIGDGLYCLSIGVLAWPDMPLSLCGDIVTYPLAYARSKQYPWALKWGDKSDDSKKSMPSESETNKEEKAPSK
jgi:hypothetical protein